MSAVRTIQRAMDRRNAKLQNRKAKAAPYFVREVALPRVKVIGSKIHRGHFIQWERAITAGNSIYLEFSDGSLRVN